MKTQLVGGPPPEFARGMSSRRILGLWADPLVHYWRTSPYAVHTTTQPRALCGAKIALGVFEVNARAAVCSACEFQSRRQQRLR